MEHIVFRKTCACEFGSSPGAVETHLVVLDASDQVIYVERSSHSEEQDPPARFSIPQTTFHVEDLGLLCSHASNGESVTIFFSSRIEMEDFAAKVRTLSAQDGTRSTQDSTHQGLDVQLGHVGHPLLLSDGTPAINVLQPVANAELAPTHHRALLDPPSHPGSSTNSAPQSPARIRSFLQQPAPYTPANPSAILSPTSHPTRSPSHEPAHPPPPQPPSDPSAVDSSASTLTDLTADPAAHSLPPPPHFPPAASHAGHGIQEVGTASGPTLEAGRALLSSHSLSTEPAGDGATTAGPHASLSPPSPSFKLTPVSVSHRTLRGAIPSSLGRNDSVKGDAGEELPALDRTPSLWPGPETHVETELLCSFLEDRCSVGSDPKGADAATLLLRRKTAGEACNSLLLPTLSERTKLIKVVEEFQDHGNVLVCRTRSAMQDVVISRDGFFRRLLMTGVGDVTYADWERTALPAVGIEKPPSLSTVSRDTKLSEVLAGMIMDGALEVAVAGKDGKVIGVLTREHIYGMVAKEYAVDSAIRDRVEKGSVSVMCDLQYEDDLEEQEQTLAMPRLRRAAADVLESATTKTAVRNWAMAEQTVLGIGLLGDLCVEVYDSLSHFPCVNCEEEWATTDAYKEHGESGIPFRSYQDCRDRVWLSDCEKIASVTNPINMWSIVSLITFFSETILRIYAYREGLFERYIELFDTLVLWLMCATFLALFLGNDGDPKRNTDLRWVIAVARCLRVVRFIRVADKLRAVVGKEKNRYQKDGFDLDLSYITETCIAMSLPATGLEAKFRNPMDEVVRFFRMKHQQGNVPHYLIYNLCQERQYSPMLFDGNVELLPTEDHNPCLMEHICDFVESADRFTSQDPNNVVAVHCKGGKGRTGMMVACWLLYSGFSSSRMKDAQQDALEWFALRRTGSEAKYKQGVGQPSQRRYISYFHHAMSSGGFRTPFLKLTKIIMHTCPSPLKREGGCEPWFVVEHGYREVFDSAKHFGIQKMAKRQPSMEFACNTLVNGDIRITFYNHLSSFPPKDEKLFFLWFHTGFIEDNRLSLDKNDIDGASRDKHHKVFRQDFRIELFFEPVTHSRVPYRKLERVSRAVLERTRQMSVRMRHDIVRQQDSRGRRLALADGMAVSRPSTIEHRLGQPRYQDAGFDLDLTYVTDNIIAMAHPGVGGKEATLQYRAELKRFFLLKHTNAFRVYNLCPDPHSLDDLFPGCTRDFPCLHRHPPPLASIAELMQDCTAYLSQDSRNVVVVCCDSGKARTGVMACACMLAQELFASSRQAIEYFNRMRGGGEFAFENPSQVRYIHHVETMMRLGREGVSVPLGDRAVPITLQQVRLWTTEEDAKLHTADEVFIEVQPPEAWADGTIPTPQQQGRRLTLQRASASEDDASGMGSRASSIEEIADAGIHVIEEGRGGAEDGGDEFEEEHTVEREWIDFEPAPGESTATLRGDVRLSVMMTSKRGPRRHLSVFFHTSLAGQAFSNDIDVMVFSNSQVEHHVDERSSAPPGEHGSIPRSFAMRLQIAFSRLYQCVWNAVHFRPERHPLAGLEEKIHKKASVKKSASMMSHVTNGESASKVLDLSSSMNQRHQVNLNLKDALPS